MSHLDEGTIHAWLDGALPADEAARVEAHARDCAECSAMVAEARGFIAGSSRIVSSLDIVRGDVIPAATGATAKPAPHGSLWKTLKFTPARAAIAATILVGVASMFSLRRQDEMRLTSPSARVTADTVAAVAAAAASAPTPAAPANQVQTEHVAPKQPTSRDVPVQSSALDAAKSRVATADTVSANNAVVAPVPAPAAARAERKFATMAPPPAVAQPAPMPVRRAFRDSTLQLGEVIVTGAAEARRDSAAAGRANASAARASSSGAVARDAIGKVARGVAGATPQALIEASVAGCYRLQVDSPTDLRGFPTQLRLAHDSTTGSHPVYAVNADRDSVLNGAGWRVLGTTVIVDGTDARFGSVQISFAPDSTRATVRSMGGTGPATIQRMSCMR